MLLRTSRLPRQGRPRPSLRRGGSGIKASPAQENGTTSLEAGWRCSVRGRDLGIGPEGAAEATTHRTPYLGADARGDAGVLGLRADGPAVRPGTQKSPGPGGQRSVCTAELRLGRKRRSIGTKLSPIWPASGLSYRCSRCGVWPVARPFTARSCTPRSRRSSRRMNWHLPSSAGFFASSDTTI
jgi:hypothetical protein